MKTVVTSGYILSTVCPCRVRRPKHDEQQIGYQQIAVLMQGPGSHVGSKLAFVLGGFLVDLPDRILESWNSRLDVNSTCQPPTSAHSRCVPVSFVLAEPGSHRVYNLILVCLLARYKSTLSILQGQ